MVLLPIIGAVTVGTFIVHHLLLVHKLDAHHAEVMKALKH